MHFHWLIALLIVVCSISRAASASDPERASIEMPPLHSGYSTVSIISLRRSWSLRNRYLFNRPNVSLKPGTYHAKIICNHSIEDTLLAPHGHSHNFTFMAQGGEKYILDCFITDDGKVQFVFQAAT